MSELNCEIPNGPAVSNAAIGGIGVLFSFFFTAVVSIVLSLTIIISEFRNKSSMLRRRLVSAYSDQQILLGIGIHSLGLANRSTMIPYHFFIIWCLGLISQAVHNAGLLSLVLNYRRDWVLRWLRQILMLTNMGLSVTYGVYILEAVKSGIEGQPIPIECAWQPGNGNSGSVGISFVGTIAVIVANAVVFILASGFLHVRKVGRLRTFLKLGGVLLMGAVAVGAIIRCAWEADAIGKGPAFEMDDGESTWSFGQVLSIIVLIFPLVSIVEIVRGDLHITPCDMSEGDGRTEASTMELGNFQPNPFFGSQTHLVKR
ncbi:hypothetical protein F5X68DRAFT_278110 [Plectosphaerella plurivora]|uniref:Uncharacterized protein n=1 Tax=Plectosphaerella plurivora TaxID=936078 RepID=A0A9P8V394_9PEZI|nr:hypothetical protein F5X68DRAFT_278110 [Plectosphaerella plurivora]